MTFDHVLPKGASACDEIGNLRLTHYRCNHGRHNRLR